MTEPRHPASDGEYHDIPDVADQTAQEAEDRGVEPQPSAPLDYADADVPDVAGEAQSGYRWP
jgi:hypothetical protein